MIATKKRISVTLADGDIRRLESLTNGYSKSYTISEALYALEKYRRERERPVLTGFGQEFDKPGNDI